MTIKRIDEMSSLSKRIWRQMPVTILLLLYICPSAQCFPDQGKWDFVMNHNVQSVTVPKSLYADSEIIVLITCDSPQPNTTISISWQLVLSECWQDSFMAFENVVPRTTNDTYFIKQNDIPAQCSNGGHIPLLEYQSSNDVKNRIKQLNDQSLKANETRPILSNRKPQVANNPVYIIQSDGVYLFALIIKGNKDYNASVHIEMRGKYGFLSAVDWPLLPFYGLMCLIYVLFGVIWLLVSFMQWRDLLRIQFWIGGVILLGMLEKAMFYAEYQSINSTGVSVRGAVLLAEWVSCAKRTLARMLVIIVSLGFGIVKPRLGPMLHRVVGTGALYFVLASVESYLRVMNIKSDPNNQILVASIPLAVLDSAICWWIFTSLVQTTRTLRLRRNMVKLTLYRHFTNTLIFAVLASVIFMLFSIKTHRLSKCLTDWKDLWEDEAFWHILFSLLLLVIMILWRPTNNNQRYAFTPLLDPEDEDDEEDQFVADVYGVKMRGSRNTNSPKLNNHSKTTTDEDDLKWVEENIPTAIVDSTLPILDSDEEIINTRFEVSKMQ
ncbi:transmembrane protein 87A [Contarinia nasturtii]|uniref:transmembrane protein 87A n=1 Tax=Contarinia nasturtii TaxID=265458 RepID=UPI0012D4372D|nr:transmembrane protein 87A [Contarinia nasturtii]XP_031632591.1 transmembrane protein 87A [Contarinia nasturtii]